MLKITKAAGEYLNKALHEARVSPASAVRFVKAPEGLKVTIDDMRPGDQSFDHNGRKVLVLDERISEELADRTLDVQRTEVGLKLRLS